MQQGLETAQTDRSPLFGIVRLQMAAQRPGGMSACPDYCNGL
jgi:hypothetical protein